MWWHDKGMDRPVGSAHGRIMRAAAALVIAALAGGCFQPPYGEQSPTGGPILRRQLPPLHLPQIGAPERTHEARTPAQSPHTPAYHLRHRPSLTPPHPTPQD